MPTETSTKATSIPVTPDAMLQLKLTLEGLRPAIWRRVTIPANATFTGLHGVIQGAMGWENYHLYSFKQERREIVGQQRLFKVFDCVRVKVEYLYDFGDSWTHQVVLEKVLANPLDRQPRVLAGEHAGPPEDCGGVWGYAELLDILNDPSHPEYNERLAWVGGAWDPEQFDLNEANARLPHLRLLKV
ncbi:plasmid pRiA4b ORF-3 family protein [Deinococcus sp. Leaf326]|uniref:plasmid pRiA4b ORF-3 family protein n=1 Tax=Deinococcus sp. Leaf326 TaxID=1736338 RepID=UPI000ABD404D|nr:plasmid pRiA4b ORF-3 family protein [Deinococcus sp. Leaf326]